jgi:hypothetical protein
VCTDCSNIANSDGTSSSPYTSCNCISSDYIWASGVCVYTFYDLFYL